MSTATRLCPPRIVLTEPNNDEPVVISPVSMEGDILIKFPGWENYSQPSSPVELDISDFPMAIMTRGATRSDPMEQVAPNVHIIRPQSRNEECLSDEEDSWSSNASVESDEDELDGTLSPVSSASSEWPSPQACAVELPKGVEEKPLRRRAHMRRTSSDSPSRSDLPLPTEPVLSSSPPSDAILGDPSFPPTPPRPIAKSRHQSVRCSVVLPPSSPTTSIPSYSPDRHSLINPSLDSNPIDWTFLEFTLGCNIVKPNPTSPTTQTEKKSRRTSIRRKPSIRARQLTLDAVREEDEEDNKSSGLGASLRETKRDRRRTALVGSSFLTK